MYVAENSAAQSMWMTDCSDPSMWMADFSITCMFWSRVTLGFSNSLQNYTGTQ
jgi:hypothetical protein